MVQIFFSSIFPKVCKNGFRTFVPGDFLDTLYKNYWYRPIFTEVIWKFRRGPAFLNHSVVTAKLLPESRKKLTVNKYIFKLFNTKKTYGAFMHASIYHMWHMALHECVLTRLAVADFTGKKRNKNKMENCLNKCAQNMHAKFHH